MPSMHGAKNMDKENTMNVYQQNGFDNRQEYLDMLAEEYGDAVYSIADMFGENEDFDGLVTTLEDMENGW